MAGGQIKSLTTTESAAVKNHKFEIVTKCAVKNNILGCCRYLWSEK